MAHQVSAKGVVGLGALGRAIDRLLPNKKNIPVVFFTVKAFDLRRALLEQNDQWPETTPFITLCNGYIWTIINDFQSKLTHRPIRVGMTTIGSTIKPGGDIQVFLDGTTTAWGHWPTSASSVTSPSPEELICLKNFPNGTWQDDIRPMIRKKWILNAAINSVAAAHRLSKNGLLTAHGQELENILVESIELSEKLWQDLPWEPGAKESIPGQLWNVVEATSGNQNSMARDMILGRQTESDFLAGMARDFAGFKRLKAIHEKITQNT